MSWELDGKKPVSSVRTYQVLMSFQYKNGWCCSFFKADRRRTALPRRAFVKTDEDLVEFIRRGGGIDCSDTRFYIESAIQRKHGDVTLRLTEEQYQVLHRKVPK